MSSFRYTRVSLSRFFVLLAMNIMPDGMPAAYISLLKANDQLKEMKR